MANINQLAAVDKISPGDLMVLFATNQGDARKASMSLLLEFITASIGNLSYVTQREIVVADGFTVVVANNQQNIWLIMTLSAAFNSGTVLMPPVADLVDGQEILITSTRQVTNFTLNGNGAANVFGAPTALAAGQSFTMRFDSASNAWYAVG